MAPDLFRGEDMVLCQIFLQREIVYGFLREIGELSIMQFKDLNSDVNAFQRTFVKEIMRCEEMERQLRFFFSEMIKNGFEAGQTAPNEVIAMEPRFIVDLEALLTNQEDRLREVTNNIDLLQKNEHDLNEMKLVLEYAQALFQDNMEYLTYETSGSLEKESDIELHDIETEQDSRFSTEFFTGIMGYEKLLPFLRMLWLVCHGNALARYVQLELPKSSGSDEVERKVIFVVFSRGQKLRAKVKKICEGFRASLYPCPPSATERDEILKGIRSRLRDLDTVIAKSKEERRQILMHITSQEPNWKIQVFKIKAIYHVMNQLQQEGNANFIAEGWCPRDELPNIQRTIDSVSEKLHSTAPSLIQELSTDTLPTYHRNNKFTQVFQTITNSYGTPSYKEINPAPYGIITFPFLFAVMFGDAGHAIIMFFFGLWMVLWEKKLAAKNSNNEIWNIFFGGRYIILMMGIFSIYTGLIYNDFFSKSINIFGSKWHVVYDDKTLISAASRTLDPANKTVYDGYPIPFGMDPVWQLSSNKITFQNSFKEKISVIFGVMQMLLGIVLSLFNHIYFKDRLSIFTEFIPRLIFLLSMFGYLVLLIFIKWIKFTAEDSFCAPSLLLGLINMFLMKYPEGDSDPCSIKTWYSGQKEVQIVLILIIVICIPWMLMVKPLILRHRNKVDDLLTDGSSPDHSDTEQILSDIGPSNTPEKQFDFGELMILQSIHTIEFCLGCISHTASYLRLWALSLAHTQLSEVLWNMVMRNGLIMPGYIGAAILPFVFAAWAFLTVAILILMEGLSAFLHTLRLHWVEFQSKFYEGDGTPFDPFSFKKIIENAEVI